MVTSRKRYVSITLLVPCLVFLAIVTVLAVDEATQKTKQLQELKKSVDKVRKDRSNVVAKERSVLTELKTIEKQLDEKDKELRKYELSLASSEVELNGLKKNLTGAELRLARTKETMLKRMRAMYKFGYRGDNISYLKLLLGAEDISDFATRYKYMNAIAKGDRDLLDMAIAEKMEIDFRKRLVEEKKGQIISYKDATEKIKTDILDKRKARQATLAKVRASKENLTRTLNELERSVNELENLIARLRNTTEKGKRYEEVVSNLGGQGGKLPWPVSGKIISNAAPSMKGVTIEANYGDGIRCVDDGVIDYARWFDGVGFGQMVIVNHGGGYRTLYAHASEILVKEGQRVKKGQVIARVGDTGSINGSVLYFEVWKGTRALPTRQWLASQ